ncbi:MAG TPA: hypothetical protein VNN80_13200 [Polyangiaceae bacterium]|nr:hypothetical protein [Polyangiaceae bacterium]
MSRPISLLAVIVLLGCASAATQRGRQLAVYRTELDQVRARERDPTEPRFELKPHGDASVLIGMTKAEIRAALGQPFENPLNHWTYSFYKLPPGVAGGGPELSLYFDPSERCEKAFWEYSE